MFLMRFARFQHSQTSAGCFCIWTVRVSRMRSRYFDAHRRKSPGELVVFFNKERSADFGYRVKQGGHLASKMRFLAAPCLALLADEVWLKNARQANEAALKLASGLRSSGAEIVFPVESNAVFSRLDVIVAENLRERGWDFSKFIEPDIYRLMC